MEKNKKNHKFLEHTADIKFQAYGRNIEEAFANSVIAMFSAMYEGKVQRMYTHKIRVGGKDMESLLYNFLEEFIYLLDSKGAFVSEIDEIKIDKENYTIECTFSGDLAEKYDIETIVKAVTYNDMLIKEMNGKWMVQVVLDI